MKRYDLLYNGQSHTAAVIFPAVGTIGFKKAIKYTLLVLRENTNARIGYADRHVLDILFDADVNPTAILGKFDAIAEDIGPYLI